VSLTSNPVWLTAALVPLVAWAISVAGGVEVSGWLLPPEALRRGLAADALLYTAAAAIVGAPLMGAALAATARRRALAPVWRRRESAPLLRGGALTLWWPIAVGVALFVLVSAVVTTLAWGFSGDTLVFVATSHATLGAVTLGLAAVGALCGSLVRDPLDAGAMAAGLSVATAAGVLLAGGAVADAPGTLIDIALLASPLVAVASSAHVDLVRMEPLYQISPLAHRAFDYPSWYAATSWHLAVTVACFVAVGRVGRTGSGNPVHGRD
jgi:hypothetical protein